jgi:hypothetical protein
MRKAIYVSTAVALVVALAAQTGCRRKVSQDEGPIIVQNGSMTVDTDKDAEWQDDGGGAGGAWKNETGKDHGGDLWVWVYLNDGTTCSGHGTPVQINYSAGGFKAKFDVVGNPPRTKVSPKGQFELKTKQRLGHGADGDGGYINGVEIHQQPLTCNITSTNLTSIHICSTGDEQKCK